MYRNAAPSRPTSSVPVPGTSTSRRPDDPTSSAAFVNRLIGAATVPAINHPTSAAANDTSDHQQDSVRRRRSVEHAVDLVERPPDLDGTVRQADRVHPNVVAVVTAIVSRSSCLGLPDHIRRRRRRSERRRGTTSR